MPWFGNGPGSAGTVIGWYVAPVAPTRASQMLFALVPPEEFASAFAMNRLCCSVTDSRIEPYCVLLDRPESVAGWSTSSTSALGTARYVKVWLFWR
jgi:hypothetical protein